MKMINKVLLLGIFLFLPTLLFGSIDSNNQTQGILEQFSNATAFWVSTIKPAGMYLFWSFVTIDMVITFGFLAIKGTEFGEIVGELIRKILWIGFFLFLFQTANILEQIPDSFAKIALSATGKDIQPDTILETAFELVKKMWTAPSLIDILSIDTVVGIFAGFIALVAFALMAAQLFLTLVKIQALIAGTYLVLAFGGLSYTRQMAINPLKAIFSAGLELMFIKMFMALTIQTVEQFTMDVSNDTETYMVVIVTSILLASVVKMVPGLVSSLMDGTLGGNSTSGLAVAAAVVGGTVAGTIGAGKAVSAAKELSAAGQGSVLGNVAKSVGSDILKSMGGENKRAQGTAGSRAAGEMKNQAARLNEQNTASNPSSSGSQSAKQEAGNYVSSVPSGGDRQSSYHKQFGKK